MNQESDHDIILDLRGDVKAIKNDLREMKENTKWQIEDHEKRLRFLERYVWLAVGAAMLIEFYIIYVHK